MQMKMNISKYRATIITLANPTARSVTNKIMQTRIITGIPPQKPRASITGSSAAVSIPPVALPPATTLATSDVIFVVTL